MIFIWNELKNQPPEPDLGLKLAPKVKFNETKVR